ncbi:hypothetical protein KL928_001384 [Ogataea angusta]|uniref:Uncharacterized protein n=1 Tax=Pichia angusta TaxID=870730 RepID=A0AAN6DIH9_PICAN|nr:uncharacterized protein KL928_001384 [Ogataea angusta]KAG7821300.1 hypothetical protein KL928_001384 [Ogataea angusta]
MNGLDEVRRLEKSVGGGGTALSQAEAEILSRNSQSQANLDEDQLETDRLARNLPEVTLHQDPRSDAGVYPSVFQGAFASERRGRARAAHEVLQGVWAGDRGAGAAAQDRRSGVQQGGRRRSSAGQDLAAESKVARDAAADQAGGQGRPAVAVHERIQEPRAARRETTGHRGSV